MVEQLTSQSPQLYKAEVNAFLKYAGTSNPAFEGTRLIETAEVTVELDGQEESVAKEVHEIKLPDDSSIAWSDDYRMTVFIADDGRKVAQVSQALPR